MMAFNTISRYSSIQNVIAYNIAGTIMNIYKLALYSTFFSGIALSGAIAASPQSPDPMINAAIKETATNPVPAPAPEPQISTPVTPLTPTDKIAVTEPKTKETLTVHPALSISEYYDDNIFAAENNTDDDFVTEINPSLTLNWERGSSFLKASASYLSRLYSDHTSLSHNGYSMNIDASAALSNSLSFPFSASWSRTHEDYADDLSRQIASTPIEQDTGTAKAAFKFKPAKLGLILGGEYTHEYFRDSADFAATNQIIRSDADRQTGFAFLGLDYDLTDHVSLIAEGKIGERNYSTNNFQGGAFTGPKRDSDIWLAQAGARFDHDALSGKVLIGYQAYDYEDQSLNDSDDIISTVQLDWQIAQNTLMSLHGQREIIEDDQIVNAITKSKTALSLSHDLNDQWVVGLNGGGALLEFEGSNREDTLYNGGASIDYHLSDNFVIGAAYDYTTRDSDNTTDLDFNRNKIMLRAKGQL